MRESDMVCRVLGFSVGLAMLALPGWAQSGGSCDVGTCTASDYIRDGGPEKQLLGVDVARIRNAEEGPSAGTFNFISSFRVKSGDLTAKVFYSDEKHFQEDVILTVYYPATVAGTSVVLTSPGTDFDLDLTSAAGLTVFFEVQGSVVLDDVADDEFSYPLMSVSIFEK
jgi:hypothetical protein